MTDEFDPLTGDPLPQNTVRNAAITPVNAPPDLSALDLMTADELRALIRRCCADKAAVLAMTPEQQGQAMIDKLAVIALTGDGKPVLEAIREWLDRVRGRPVQRVEQRTTLTLEQLVLQAYSEPSAALDRVRQNVIDNPS